MRLFALFALSLFSISIQAWGFFAHQQIHLHAILALPQPLFAFYRAHAHEMIAWSTKADQRRYIVENEGAKHYIDIDQFEQFLPLDTLPYYWDSAVAKYSEDSLAEHGILPWNLLRQYYSLIRAFKLVDEGQILRISADLGHYLSDAHVPLHTCSNYNGQLSGQHGIHSLWESRLVELYIAKYNLLTPDLKSIEHPLQSIWQIIEESHTAVDSVLAFDLLLSEHKQRSMAYEERNGRAALVVERKYCERYHNMLNGMIERRLRASIHLTACFWYSAWLNAGSPKLQTATSPAKEEVEIMIPHELGDHIH